MTIYANNLVGLSYNPNSLRFGNTDSVQNLLERQRNQTILQGSLRLFQLQMDYTNSYLNIPALTLLAYRDMLLSVALAMVGRCAQTRDVLYLEMTSHANKYWAAYGNNFWSSVPLYSDNPNFTPVKGFYGVAGSLAFWMYLHEDTGQGLYPTELIQKMLHYFWSDLGADPTATVSTIHETVLNKTQLDQLPLGSYESLFNRLIGADLTTLQNWEAQIALALRRNLLTVGDWENLRSRWLLNEINLTLVKVIQQMVIQDTVSDIYSTPYFVETVSNNLLNVAPPAGMPLVYIAFAVQGLVNAIELINNQTTLYDVPFSDFIAQTTYEDLRYEIAVQLATVYDAFGALSMFNTFYEAAGLSYRFLVAINQLTTQTINQIGPTRLSKFLWP